MTQSNQLVTALEDVARRLDGVQFVLGGSAMMVCLGIPVTVGDIDLLVDADTRLDVVERVPEATFQRSDDVNYCSAWRAAFQSNTMDVEVIGGFCFIDNGKRFALPTSGSGFVVAGVELAPVAPWVVFYRTVNPAKAVLLEPFTSVAEIADVAASMAV